MNVKAPMISDKERISLMIQGMNPDIFKNAFIFIDTGNWDELLPKTIPPEDIPQLKGIIASTSAGLVRLVLIAIAQDYVSFRDFQSPHLLSILEAMEEIATNIGFEAWAMDHSA